MEVSGRVIPHDTRSPLKQDANLTDTFQTRFHLKVVVRKGSERPASLTPRKAVGLLYRYLRPACYGCIKPTLRHRLILITTLQSGQTPYPSDEISMHRCGKLLLRRPQGRYWKSMVSCATQVYGQRPGRRSSFKGIRRSPDRGINRQPNRLPRQS